MVLLPEENVVELYGRKILILHGDTLCTDDTDYQHFRKKVHNPLIQNYFVDPSAPASAYCGLYAE